MYVRFSRHRVVLSLSNSNRMSMSMSMQRPSPCPAAAVRSCWLRGDGTEMKDLKEKIATLSGSKRSQCNRATSRIAISNMAQIQYKARIELEQIERRQLDSSFPETLHNNLKAPRMKTTKNQN